MEIVKQFWAKFGQYLVAVVIAAVVAYVTRTPFVPPPPPVQVVVSVPADAKVSTGDCRCDVCPARTTSDDKK